MSWKDVWGARRRDAASSSLQALIDLDGFDTGAGRIAEPAWRDYVGRIARLLGMRAGESVLEVGCGAGAFLLPLREAGLRVAGIDYSPALIEAAQRAMPDGDFALGEALSISGQYDYVVANSVFHYFPDAGYADRVLAAMLAAARRGVAVLEVPDLATKDQAEAARRGALGEEEYRRKYAGLEHRYYARQDLIEAARCAGFEAEIHAQAIDGYAQNPFRFNCLMRRVRG
jgi:trans-aconitate methyltransferase